MSLESIKQPIADKVIAPLTDGSTLLAVVPVSQILSKGGIKQPESALKRAGKLPDEILKRCKTFLLEPKFEKINLNLPKIDFLDINEKLSEAVDQRWVAEKLSHLPNLESQQSFSLALGKAFEYLRMQIPKIPVSITSRASRPSDFEVSRFNRIYRTVDDPMTILSDLEQGCLSREQVITLEAVYPSLYILIKEGLLSSAIEITSKDKEFVVPYPKLKQISVLLLSSTVQPDLQSILQDNFEKASADEVPTRGGALNLAESAETNISKMQNR